MNKQRPVEVRAQSRVISFAPTCFDRGNASHPEWLTHEICMAHGVLQSDNESEVVTGEATGQFNILGTLFSSK